MAASSASLVGSRVDLLAGDGGVGRADDVLGGEVVADFLAACDADHDGGRPEREQHDRCCKPSGGEHVVGLSNAVEHGHSFRSRPFPKSCVTVLHST
jgi:hypothetical protein